MGSLRYITPTMTIYYCCNDKATSLSSALIQSTLIVSVYWFAIILGGRESTSTGASAKEWKSILTRTGQQRPAKLVKQKNNNDTNRQDSVYCGGWAAARQANKGWLWVYIAQQSFTKVLLQAISCIGNSRGSLNNYSLQIHIVLLLLLLLQFYLTRIVYQSGKLFARFVNQPTSSSVQLLNKLIKITYQWKGEKQ